MRGAWVLVAALAFAAASQAQLQRFLPNDGHYGELHDQRQQPLPLLQIDKKILRLAPGGRIYDQQNRIIVHGSLPDSAPVLFVRDMNGDIARLWILLPGEIQRLKPAPKPEPQPKPKA
ncbi:MAG TPA: hypothetical protein VKD25_09575 [Burkholderiales bacterium]|nr:hypothetical protein [Burkholderiales bacterium]